MALRNQLVYRVTGLFVRWGMVKHPYGREYARERYTITGRRTPDIESTRTSGRLSPRTGAALVGVALLLMSLLATGILFASGG
ncbi:hypothetical protein [Salinigranum marinum]|uniref:hypothetical protein n=1 Tax=Salinigranum marinum TaxID=1515595 RepID=UPI002989D28F|nr:hypothetical protein [Salinigranum marinum]